MLYIILFKLSLQLCFTSYSLKDGRQICFQLSSEDAVLNMIQKNMKFSWRGGSPRFLAAGF